MTEQNSPKAIFRRRFTWAVAILYVFIAAIVAYETRKVVVHEGFLWNTTEARKVFNFAVFFGLLVWPGFFVYFGGRFAGLLVWEAFYGNQDRSAGPASTGSPPPPPHESSDGGLAPFFQTYLHLAAQLCRADGPVSPAEIAFLNNAFVEEMEFDEGQIREARRCFRDGKQMDLEISSAAQEVRGALGADRAAVDTYAAFLIGLALADGPLKQAETLFLRRFLSSFGYTVSQIDVWLSDPERASSEDGSSLERALELLELQEDFSKEELRAAYKAKVKEFHPDKLMNLSSGLRKLAEEQLKEINLAYAKLKLTVSS